MEKELNVSDLERAASDSDHLIMSSKVVLRLLRVVRAAMEDHADCDIGPGGMPDPNGEIIRCPLCECDSLTGLRLEPDA